MSKNEEIFLEKLKNFKLNVGAFTQPFEIEEEEDKPESKEAC